MINIDIGENVGTGGKITCRSNSMLGRLQGMKQAKHVMYACMYVCMHAYGANLIYVS